MCAIDERSNRRQHRDQAPQEPNTAQQARAEISLQEVAHQRRPSGERTSVARRNQHPFGRVDLRIYAKPLPRRLACGTPHFSLQLGGIINALQRAHIQAVAAGLRGSLITWLAGGFGAFLASALQNPRSQRLQIVAAAFRTSIGQVFFTKNNILITVALIPPQYGGGDSPAVASAIANRL